MLNTMYHMFYFYKVHFWENIRNEMTMVFTLRLLNLGKI